uniref:Male-enhanced antigen 1 n=1 Tax=Pectinophora gossypiella TaxID=13191 RepID=A0A1E1WEK3_PECGO
MVCHGPDPPDHSPQELTPPTRQELLMNGPQADESDEEQTEHFGYEPLPQGPDAVHSDHESDDEDENVGLQVPPSDVPTIEPIETALTREVWNSPRPIDPIQMDNERAQEVMSAMANFALPQTSIPEWAQSISEEQWKQTLIDKIEKIKSNR